MVDQLHFLVLYFYLSASGYEPPHTKLLLFVKKTNETLAAHGLEEHFVQKICV